MIHFENYRWEDHVPRKGSWKFNLAVGALAFGLIAAALPDGHVDGKSMLSASAQPAPEMALPAFDMPARVTPAAFTGSVDERAPCPDQYAITHNTKELPFAGAL